MLNSAQHIGTDFNLISAGRFDFKVNPAYKMVFTYTAAKGINPGPQQEAQYIVINGNDVYQISYFAHLDQYSVFLPTAKNMISSVELTST